MTIANVAAHRWRAGHTGPNEGDGGRGWVFREETNRPPGPVVLAGLWVLFLPGLVCLPLVWLGGHYNGEPLGGLIVYFVMAIILLGSATTRFDARPERSTQKLRVVLPRHGLAFGHDRPGERHLQGILGQLTADRHFQALHGAFHPWDESCPGAEFVHPQS